MKLQFKQIQQAPISTCLGEIYFYVLHYADDETNKPPTRQEQCMELKLVQKFIVAPSHYDKQGRV